jgi:hypothetical protein
MFLAVTRESPFLLSLLKLGSDRMKSGSLNAEILEVSLENTFNEYHRQVVNM